MSTTVTYKGNTIATVNNSTVVLNTEGTWLEDDVTLVDVSGGGGVTEAELKDVNFYDYDGTRVYSYTALEFSQLSTLPASPTHQGLVFEKWSWDKAHIDDTLADVPGQPIHIASFWNTSDGKTRIYLYVDFAIAPYLGLCINGSVTIDWGDGSNTETMTGTSLITAVYLQHAYNRGEYILTIDVNSGSFALKGDTNNPYILRNLTTSSVNFSRAITGTIHRIELGDDVKIGGNAFTALYGLEKLTVHSGIFDGQTNMFVDCHSLQYSPHPNPAPNMYSGSSAKIVTISQNVTSLGDSVFTNANSLRTVSFPYGLTSIGNAVFQNCYSLLRLWFPSTLTSIGQNAFNGCAGVKEYHFRSTTPPTLANTNAFTGTPTLSKIYVPYSADHSILNAYKNATNWSNYASRMEEES